ncbi:MAG TPA: hypothetical protein PKI71_10375, partial [Candidatus Rifleibacterium sp.]|nr:hypothetical protein [Candidatus Rifleibacterium sp.]
TEGGDIMLANIGGKRVTLVINHDQGRVNVGQAKLGESMNVTAGGFKGGQFEHTGADDSLKLVFNGVNGKYMNDVTIDKVASHQGVQVSNLDSLTARINADTDIFQLSSVDLLGVGVFSNNQTSVIVPGSENASLEIIIKGESTSITRQAKHLNEPSLADRIASIVDSNTNGLQSSAGATEPSDHSAQKNEIEYSDFIYSGAIPSAITAHGGRVYLTSVDTENDSVVTAETEDENSEMEPNN